MWFLSENRMVLVNVASGVRIIIDNTVSPQVVCYTGENRAVLSSGTESHCRRIFEQIVLNLRHNGETVLYYGPVRCEHGVPDGDWCPQCNREYKQARDAQDGPPRSDEAVEIIEDDGYQD